MSQTIIFGKFSYLKSFLVKTKFLSKESFGQTILGQKNLLKNSLSKIFSTKKFVQPKNFIVQNIFQPKTFSTKAFFDQKISLTKKMFDQKNFQFFHQVFLSFDQNFVFTKKDLRSKIKFTKNYVLTQNLSG